MSVDSILKRERITVVRKLETLEVNRIAKNISDKINKFFSDFILNSEDLFVVLSRIDMYLAKMPTDSSCAKYLYINDSIYFNEKYSLDISENSIFALHECLHFIQTCRLDNGKVYRLGLYDLKKHGMALNEAAVQYMASIAQGATSSTEKYYDININTISPDYYPLQCALLAEMMYFTGDYPLYQSTLNSNDIFKNTFISYSSKETYYKIESNLDKLLKLEDDLYYYTTEYANSSKPKEYKLLKRLIENRKSAIKTVFFDTQNIIIQNCFTTAYENIKTTEDIKNFQENLYNFKNVLCYTDDYDAYNEFYRNAMYALDLVRDTIKSGSTMAEYQNTHTELTTQNNQLSLFDFMKRFILKIKKLFSFNSRNLQETIQKNK